MTEYVATKYFRAPEILLGSTNYSLQVDIWSMGCIIAEIYMKKPTMLLYSQNIVDQLTKYFSIFGKPAEEDLNSFTSSSALGILKHLNPV